MKAITISKEHIYFKLKTKLCECKIEPPGFIRNGISYLEESPTPKPRIESGTSWSLGNDVTSGPSRQTESLNLITD